MAEEPGIVASMGTREQFITDQAATLGPLDFIVITPVPQPLAAIELAREEGGSYRATVEFAKPPASAAQQAALVALGMTEAATGWTSAALVDPAAAAACVERVLSGVVGAADTAALDIDHGSRRPIAEAQRKLGEMRARIDPILAAMVGTAPSVDKDGDYVLRIGSTEVFVSPLAVPNMPPVVRVFAITNVGVTVTPELGLFLARLNFNLLFGRFALDTDHRAVWFSETLLGEAFGDEELRFTVAMVSETADEWDDRIAQMFGGFTRATLPSDEQAARPKPGQPSPPESAGYL